MKPSQKNQHNWKQYCLRTLVGAALLSSSILPATAAGTDAGTTITNTAFGSFENPTAPGGTPPTTVNSNTVTITVAEIAGITVTAEGSNEAPAGVAGPTPGAEDGPAQGDGVINEQDIVYFTYRITNTGNDQTQFFIPGQPSNVVNGTFDETLYGPIEIITYSDGTTVTDLSGSPTPIDPAGENTDGLAGLPNDGSVPVDGFIEIRVPIKADSGLVATPTPDEITVTIGDTAAVDGQNEPFVAGTNDLFTQDNTSTDNGDAGIETPDPEREASASNSVPVGALELDYGDAPDAALGSSPAPDGTTPADYETEPGRGPSHIDDGVTFLGTGVDIEATAFSDGDPEDNGVELGGNPLHGEGLIAGQTYTLDVTAAGAGTLDAWIDFDRNGVFDAAEQIAVDEAPTAGAIGLTVTVPATAPAGPTYARFRYSTETGLAPTGAAGDGEVEDYLVNLVAADPSLRLVKRVTSVGGVPITSVVDPTTTADPNDDDTVNWPSTTYLQGDIDSTAEPFETVEYTIYFLSDGNTDINNVRICDFIPANTTYVGGSLQISQGAAAPSGLSDATADDAGENFVATPVGAPCDPAPGANTTGGVLVDVPGTLEAATAPGTPATSHGFIRFSVTVD